MPNTREKLMRICNLLRHRLRAQGARYWNAERALNALAWAYAHGVPLHELDRLARMATSWSGYFGALHERLDRQVPDPDAPDTGGPSGECPRYP